MKKYRVRVTCEYEVNVNAESEEEALELAEDADYEIYWLNNFDYEIEDSREIEDDEDEEVNK